MVFPTIWEYLQSLGVPADNVYYLGLCLSAVTLSDMVLSPFVGHLLDRCTRVSAFLLVLNLFQIVAGVLYLAAGSPLTVFLSRLIAGVGNVSTVALVTDVTRSTSREERTSVLVLFNVAQQVRLESKKSS